MKGKDALSERRVEGPYRNRAGRRERPPQEFNQDSPGGILDLWNLSTARACVLVLLLIFAFAAIAAGLWGLFLH